MTTTNLQNCDSEPIHIPGAIQPHGALIAASMATGAITHVSANAAEFVDRPLARGMHLSALLDASTMDAILSRDHQTIARMNPLPMVVGGRALRGIFHTSGDTVVVEFEPETPPANLAHEFRDALGELHAATDICELMNVAATWIRKFTGYDRVMVYRFHPDGHGEVVAERKQEALEPFLGLHYPASDIPAQARRLYVLNRTRIIVDVAYTPCKIIGDAEDVLDLSHAVLRSVSPIHIEYLRNMGVGASMSISLIVDGELWGLIACHHYSAKFVGYRLRQDCEYLANTLVALIQGLANRGAADQAGRLQELRWHTRLALADRENAGEAVLSIGDQMLDFFDAQGLAVFENGHFHSIGEVPQESDLRRLSEWAERTQVRVWSTSNVAAESDLQALPAGLPGVLIIGCPAELNNFIFWFRQQREQTIPWAGKPEKVYLEGPNGPRLSPRGSFDLWKQIITNTSVPWRREDLQAATEIRRDLVEHAAKRSHELAKARELLMSAIGHDLRSPLGAIAMSAELLKDDSESSELVNLVTQRISSSATRMNGMIDQLLTFSQVISGKVPLNLEDVAIGKLCDDVAEEVAIVYRYLGTKILVHKHNLSIVRCDAHQVSRIITNLLTNACKYGDSKFPVVVDVDVDADNHVTIAVTNRGPIIPPDMLGTLFQPFVRQPSTSKNPSGGLGLGLYIVQKLANAHGGSVTVLSRDHQNRFTLRIPRDA